MKFRMRDILIVVVVTVFVLSTCKTDNSSSADCFGCVENKPDSASLTIKLTINGENPYVPIVVLKGKFKYDYNPTDIVRVDTISDGTYYLPVATDNYYSIKAEYKDGSKIVYAIDGDNFTTVKCEDHCWVANGGYLDARLKK
jgi:hypothetical protein